MKIDVRNLTFVQLHLSMKNAPEVNILLFNKKHIYETDVLNLIIINFPFNNIFHRCFIEFTVTEEILKFSFLTS